MTDDTSEDGLMTLAEVADYLGPTDLTVYLGDHFGRLPAFRMGSTWMFRKVEVDQWLKSRTTEPLPHNPVRLTDSVPPPFSSFRESQARQDAEQAKVNECESAILRAIVDEDRDVWTTEQFEYVYGLEVAGRAIRRLRQERKIAVAEERGLLGHKVKVIRRR